MSFAMLPPEINSTRMYTGPGSGPLWAAAAAWHEVSAELQSVADTYRSVVESLTSLQWMGPASASMIAAVTPYIEWLTTTSVQARQTAMQATTAANGFEQAFAMTVPPPLVMANRAEVVTLTATNFFGQNTSAIAALEAQYAEMWEQDATAMFDYAAASTAATKLTPFTPPQQDTNQSGLAAQSAAVGKASANAAADGGNWLGNLLEEIGTLLIPIAPELAPFFFGAGELINMLPFPSMVADDFTFLDGVLAFYATISSIQNIESMGTGMIGAEDTLGMIPKGAAPVADAAPAEASELLVPLTELSRAVSSGALKGGMGDVSAGMRSAGRVGQMSVPASWEAPAVSNVKAFDATPMTTLPGGDAAPAAGAPGMPGMLAAGSGGRGGGMVPRYGAKLTVMTRPLSGG